MSDLAMLAVYPNEMEARLWASVLEQEGIRTLVKPLGVGYVYPGPISFQEHGVFVLTEDIENARAIIQTNDEA